MMKKKLFESKFFQKKFGRWLYIEKIFLEYEGIPGLCVCVDASEKRYFCHCTEMMEFERWCIHPISKSKMIDILSKKCTLEQALNQNEQKVFIYTVDESGENGEFQFYRDLDEYDRPEESIYLRSAPHQFDSYIDTLEMVSLQMSSAAILNLGSAIISLGAQIGQRLMESDIMIRYDEKNESTEIEDENILLFQKNVCIYA